MFWFTIVYMAKSSVPFSLRGETLGFGQPDVWAKPALYLLFSVPRVYAPFASAWDKRVPGTLKALKKLTDMGFVQYQEPIIMNTITGEHADAPSRAVDRYRTTAAGKRLLESIEHDSGALQEFTPKTSPENRLGVQNILTQGDVEINKAPNGVSTAYLSSASGLAARTARWWIQRLTERSYLRKLDDKAADTRVVIPGHWRATRLLARHVIDVTGELELFHADSSLRSELRLDRTRFLEDIDPSRVGLGGATDYDHDIETQRAIIELLRSPRFIAKGVFSVEPSFNIRIDSSTQPWEFNKKENKNSRTVAYQPDAIFKEHSTSGVRRAVLEYERFQTRRDGWAHIERFMGWAHMSVLVFEPIVLRFVVASTPRARSYTELVEAYYDWIQENNAYRPTHQISLEVASLQDLQDAADPLEPRVWSRLQLPRFEGPGDPIPVLHSDKYSPYDQYF